MRNEGNKKKSLNVSLPALIVIVLAIVVALTIVGAFLWVLYGNDSDKGKGKAPVSMAEEQGAEPEETATLDVAANWSVPERAFKGSNGSGKFIQKRVVNKMDTQMLYENMGVSEDASTGEDKKRVDAVKRFISGLYYEADVETDLSNGDTVTVTIMSKEEVSEIEREAGIEITGVGETKEVTVSGLAEKYSVWELQSMQDLIEAAKSAAEERIREATDGNKQEIFANESEYDVSFTFYGVYLAEPADDSADDSLIVLYRLQSTYPDSEYQGWSSDGDYVYTYEMTHFTGIDKNTDVADIEEGLKYDSFRYENEAYDVLEWYRQNLDTSTTYTINKVA